MRRKTLFFFARNFRILASMPVQPSARFFTSLQRAHGYRSIAGVDEVGCGCLAGPVVAAAVVLRGPTPLPQVRDSKLLSPNQRERLAEQINKRPAVLWQIGEASVEEIDRLGIRPATVLASRRALLGLAEAPDAVVSDAFPIPDLPFPCHPLVRADQRCRAVAAASILAKVHRDRLMDHYEKTHPGYGFTRHKGYGTREHLAALQELGPCSIHRMSFAPVRAAVMCRVTKKPKDPLDRQEVHGR